MNSIKESVRKPTTRTALFLCAGLLLIVIVAVLLVLFVVHQPQQPTYHFNGRISLHWLSSSHVLAAL